MGFSAVFATALALGGPTPPPEAIAWAVAAGLGGTLGLGAFFVALARAPMGLVAPVAAVVAAGLPAAVGIAGGDALPFHRAVGLLLAIVAVALVSLTADASRGGSVAPGGGLLLAAVAGVGFAAFYLLIARASDVAAGASAFWLLVPVRATGISAITLVFLVRRPGVPALPRAALPILVLSGIGDVGGNLFFLLAQGSLPLSVAAVLSSLYPVVTVLLAAAVLHERLARVQLAGVAAAFAALVLIPL